MSCLCVAKISKCRIKAGMKFVSLILLSKFFSKRLRNHYKGNLHDHPRSINKVSKTNWTNETVEIWIQIHRRAPIYNLKLTIQIDSATMNSHWMTYQNYVCKDATNIRYRKIVLLKLFYSLSFLIFVCLLSIDLSIWIRIEKNNNRRNNRRMIRQRAVTRCLT